MVPYELGTLRDAVMDAVGREPIDPLDLHFHGGDGVVGDVTGAALTQAPIHHQGHVARVNTFFKLAVKLDQRHLGHIQNIAPQRKQGEQPTRHRRGERAHSAGGKCCHEVYEPG